MNERILELARVAEQLADDELAHLERVHNRLYSFTEGRELYNKKFAELIVKECATLTLDPMQIDEAQYYHGWLDYRDKIWKHFGVEE